MPPGPTLDKRDETRRARATGDGDAHQCRTPVALGAERSVPLVKGGIARAPGSQQRRSGHVAYAETVGRSSDHVRRAWSKGGALGEFYLLAKMLTGKTGQASTASRCIRGWSNKASSIWGATENPC